MINQYISERFLFAYFHRKPPIYGPSMNIKALAILRFAPMMMLSFGYWQLGNRQIFFNDFSSKLNQGDLQETNHKLLDYSEGVNHTAIFLVFLPIMIFFREFLQILKRLARCFGLFNKQIKGIS